MWGWRCVQVSVLQRTTWRGSHLQLEQTWRWHLRPARFLFHKGHPQCYPLWGYEELEWQKPFPPGKGAEKHKTNNSSEWAFSFSCSPILKLSNQYIHNWSKNYLGSLILLSVCYIYIVSNHYNLFFIIDSSLWCFVSMLFFLKLNNIYLLTFWQ